MPVFKFHGLCPATHTPFHADGSLHLAVVEKQAAYLQARHINAVFIGGTTGESTSLTLAERLALGDRWAQVAQTSGMQVVVHVALERRMPPAAAHSCALTSGLPTPESKRGGCTAGAEGSGVGE